jgi:hypothetical protein
MDYSYNIGPLRCFPALSLYASFDPKPEAAADTACGSSGRLPAEARAPFRFSDTTLPVAEIA